MGRHDAGAASSDMLPPQTWVRDTCCYRLTRAMRPRRVGLLLITDPGPDPDDCKALLVAASMHRWGQAVVRGVVCNGGQQARQRARLARCLLDHVNARDIPVGVGTPGRVYTPQPHEYALHGYDLVDETRLLPGPIVITHALQESPPASLCVVIISGMTDFEHIIRKWENLVVDKVSRVIVQGGLEEDPQSPGGYRPDTSVNNGFDMAAAAAVYSFCFDRGIPLTVVSRHAVPLLPMQLARSFAERTECPVMHYLASAQTLGLEGLWKKLCQGNLPARCTKAWYFENFCGVSMEQFERNTYASLDEDAQIGNHLNGYVKPYDVVAIMLAVPTNVRRNVASAHVTVGETQHELLLSADQAIGPVPVIELLRDVYHEVVLETSARQRATTVLRRSSRSSSRMARRDPCLRSVVPLNPAAAEASPIRETAASRTLSPSSRSSSQLRKSAVADSNLPDCTPVRQAEVPAARSVGATLLKPMAVEEIVRVLSAAMECAEARQKALSRFTVGTFVPMTAALTIVVIVEVLFATRKSKDGVVNNSGADIRLSVYWLLGSLMIAALILPLRASASSLARIRAVTIVWVLGQLTVCFFYLQGLLVAMSVGEQYWRASMLPSVRALFAARTLLCIFSLCLLAVLAARWTSARPLLDALWVESGMFITAEASIELVSIALGMPAPRNGPGVPDWKLPVDVVCAVCSLGVGLVLLCARQQTQAFVSRHIAASGVSASIAPFLGFGSVRGTTDIRRLCLSDLQRALHPLALSPETCRAAPLRELLAMPPGAHRILVRATSALGLSPPEESGRIATRGVHAPGESPEPQAVDVYVVHALEDDPAAKVDALAAWARAFSDVHGRCPRVHLDCVTANDSLDSEEQLAHVPAYLARSRQLLLLAGPSFVDSLSCVGECWCWQALGGSLADVDVAIVARTATEADRTVAAFDAFHVLYARHDCEAVVARQVQHVVEIASPTAVNRAIRAALPRVQDAAAQWRARHVALGEDDVEEPGGLQPSARSAASLVKAPAVAVVPGRQGSISNSFHEI